MGGKKDFLDCICQKRNYLTVSLHIFTVDLSPFCSKNVASLLCIIIIIES